MALQSVISNRFPGLPRSTAWSENAAGVRSQGAKKRPERRNGGRGYMSVDGVMTVDLKFLVLGGRYEREGRE